MSDSNSSPKPVNVGRPARWGKRHARSIRFPEELHARIKQRADESGLPVGEYIVLMLAPMHGIELPDPSPNRRRNRPVPPLAFPTGDQEQPALPMGA